jgi:hypothetical protein
MVHSKSDSFYEVSSIWRVTAVGMADILKERGLYSEKNPRTGLKIPASCKVKKGEVSRYLDGSLSEYCYYMHILGRQPDFVSQKSALFEVVEGTGHIVDLYLKFYCECNWIERYWCASKKIARKYCSYNYKDLKDSLPGYMDQVPHYEVSAHDME